jgi:hypothetical protein
LLPIVLIGKSTIAHVNVTGDQKSTEDVIGLRYISKPSILTYFGPYSEIGDFQVTCEINGRKDIRWYKDSPYILNIEF